MQLKWTKTVHIARDRYKLFKNHTVKFPRSCHLKKYCGYNETINIYI